MEIQHRVDAYGQMPCDECGDVFNPRTTPDGEALDHRCDACLRLDVNISEHLREFVELVLERKMREADVTGGHRVPHGSEEHVKDLEARIADLSSWRDRQRRGSEARANYSRIVSRLKNELSSARRTAAKNNVKESIDEPTTSADRILRIRDSSGKVKARK